ncbi:hypothetical protein HOP50_05g39960 [Chloropicon primus]|uniref:Uncharacterized protein n=1 Tax=Chloropicon primus TaxID=1764295 RepID=A0A5B8MLZ8_9CHLO|nr:hypothetical protein A3770_05p39870 [Chloropicon primus]UPR00681.1 hypothetical protein HOP50_05g39960 [Chloropicon primus]|mmetsp:Transcript_8281/g.23690  ORF Transcript_8281/g.23690 Transcript_8281/m.23690 type:complete len:155 (-) Transcript_8281:1060-1524(-)|eukprot:QDZ21469.1 hypothetical protein A3770_05p39870 [Chloropicon primus]
MRVVPRARASVAPRGAGSGRRCRRAGRQASLREEGGRPRASWIQPLRAKEAEEDVSAEDQKAEEPKLTAGGLAELVGLGMGLPVPAKTTYDPEKKQIVAEFEANNFAQEQKYRDSGYVDEGATFNWLTLLWLPAIGGIGYGIFLTLQALASQAK